MTKMLIYYSQFNFLCKIK